MKNKEIDLENQTDEIKYQRISESYPPNTVNNYRYLAEIHGILSQIDMNQINLMEDIQPRHISNRYDLHQLQVLHAEWFPIKYEQPFFDSLMENSSKNLLLELDLTKFGFGKYIIASIIYVKRSTKFKEMKFTMKEMCADTYCYYIQTIGVINEFRKCGLATHLLDYIKQESLKNQSIKYICLHMVTYNRSGERFYLKNGFKIIDKFKEFYYIEKKEYDSYLFSYYLNGGEPPVSIFGYLHSVFSSAIVKIKSISSKKSYKEDQNDIKII